MKYIRTKNKIFEVVNSFVDYHQKRIYEVLSNQLIEETEVVKEADTIEELCDEFVIKGTRGRYLGIPLQECELRNIPITQIYGAIWTDEGLIYVAKMNEKGELELL